MDAAGPSVPGLQSPNDLANILLGPGVTLAPGTEALVNLQTSAQLPNQMANCRVEGGPDQIPCSPLPSFGRFSNGTGDLGIPNGLIITANAAAQNFATNSFGAENIALKRDATASYSDAVALGAVTAAAGLGSNAQSTTSLSFQLQPPPPGQGRYLKFEYSLLITEVGDWNNLTPGAWSGDVFGYPDGFALFTGGQAVNNNCAVVPGTNTYLSMNTAGIVPPASQYADSRADAEARLAARVADPNSPPTTPDGFATSTGELDSGSWGSGSRNTNWTVQFLTVPLTCVYDASSEIASGSPIPVEIVISNLNDGAIPPAATFAASSVRWSNSPTPTQEALLAVSRAGNGTGTVTSSPAGIDCGQVCSSNFALNSTVTLTASASTGSSFTGWSGAGCSGTGACQVTMSEAKSVTATFGSASPPIPPTPPTPPSNSFTLGTSKSNPNSLVTRVSVPGAGVISQTATRASGGKRVTACRTQPRTVSRARTVSLTCRETAATLAARRKAAVKVRLCTTFTPSGGTANTKCRTVTLAKIKAKRPKYTG